MHLLRTKPAWEACVPGHEDLICQPVFMALPPAFRGHLHGVGGFPGGAVARNRPANAGLVHSSVTVVYPTVQTWGADWLLSGAGETMPLIRSVQSLSCVFTTPWTAALYASLSITNS